MNDWKIQPAYSLPECLHKDLFLSEQPNRYKDQLQVLKDHKPKVKIRW